MKYDPKNIELEPTEYSADVPNKREPIFGKGAREWAAFIAGWIIIATAVHLAKLLFG